MKRFSKPARIVFAVIFWILVWEIAARAIDNVLLFPSPSAVLVALWGLLKTEQFYRITGTSLWNVLSGILFALLLGGIWATVTHCITLLRDLTVPLMTVVKATPVASFIVLLMIFVGASRVPTLITFLIVLPVVWTNLDEGLRRRDPQLIEVARVYRFSAFKKLRYLTLPSIKPYFISACRTSLGLAWKAGIAAEIIANPRNSIGTMIGSAKQYLNTEEMFAWTLTVILLSLLIESGFVALLNRFERKNVGRRRMTCSK
ncbi:MAG: ABC transporter permease subunit [Ruminococcaceae bacterium]|nr:ABC transporter permease subunit [Oscillospiraceae bacterium]